MRVLIICLINYRVLCVFTVLAVRVYRKTQKEISNVFPLSSRVVGSAGSKVAP
jgi:hypothetical protein